MPSAQCREALAGMPERGQRREPAACAPTTTGDDRSRGSARRSAPGRLRRCPPPPLPRLPLRLRHRARQSEHHSSRSAPRPRRQFRAALAELPARRGRAWRPGACRSTHRGDSRAGGRSDAGIDALARAAERDQVHLPPRFHDQLPQRAARWPRGPGLPATQRRPAVTELPDIARGGRRRDTSVGSSRRSSRGGSGGAPRPGRTAAPRDPRTDDESVVAKRRRPCRPAASLRTGRPAL